MEYQVTFEQRRKMIAEAAYFRAEHRGFVGGDPIADWVDAEREVDALFRKTEEGSLIERLESQLDRASEKLQEMREKIAGMTSEVRAEWDEELEKLAKLRDAFAGKVKKMRQQGEKVSQRARREAEKLQAELAQAIHRVGSRQK